MAVADEARSPSPLSSPQSISDTIAVRQAQPQPTRFLVPGDVVNTNPLPQATKDVAANAKPSTAASHDAPAPKRRQTKKKDAVEKADEKPKKPRKPRTVDPNKPTAASRKKQKIDNAPQDPAPTRQLAINDMVNQFQAPMAAPASVIPAVQQLHPGQILREDLSTGIVPPSRPASSGQRYDPIRASMAVDSYTPFPAPTPTPLTQPSPQVHRASASPAIASLMNPAASTSFKVDTSPSQTMQAPPRRPSIPNALYPPGQVIKVADNALSSVDAATPPLDAVALASPSDGLVKSEDAPIKDVKEKAAVKTAAAIVKAKRPTPPPAGSGLLSKGNLFGGPAAGDDDRTRHGVDIDIRIPLNPAGNNTINIAQEIMKKYGRDAINPRAAAHRERLLQVASMATRLENGSADDMSVDLNSENENDSNIEMGGMDDERKDDTGDGDKPKRRRRKKVEEYDKDDDFIDDAELAWQEGAAVAKDGFFVYSGPLIPVGEEAKIETQVSRDPLLSVH